MLAEWLVDFRFRKELNMSTADIENMPQEERTFYIFLLQEMDGITEKEKKQIERQQEAITRAKKMKLMRR